MIAAILGVIVYRMAIVTILYGVDIQLVSTWAKIITSVTASVINLIVIMILGLVSTYYIATYEIISNKVLNFTTIHKNIDCIISFMATAISIICYIAIFIM